MNYKPKFLSNLYLTTCVLNRSHLLMATFLCFDCLFQEESLSDLVEETINDTEEDVICPQVVSCQVFNIK